MDSSGGDSNDVGYVYTNGDNDVNCGGSSSKVDCGTDLDVGGGDSDDEGDGDDYDDIIIMVI